MSTITTIASSDLITDSRAVINTNFSNLNTDKIETSYLDTDTTLAANSDSKIATQKAVKAYVDTGGGALDASTTVKGITKLSVAPVSAVNPIAVGDNDGRVPTTGENDALVGNNTDIAVGTGNKFVTQTGLQKAAECYAADAAGSDTYVITLSPVPTSLVNGMTLRFKAQTANTGVATLNVNSLGALSIVTGLSTALATGDILANQVCEVIYNSTGTVWQLMNPASVAATIYTNGTTTKDAADASATQNIAHGLGKIPKKIKITALISNNSTTAAYMLSTTVYNGTTQSSLSIYGIAGNTVVTTFSISKAAAGNGDTTGVVTFDATNIIITWTKTNSPEGIYTLLWEAQV